MTDDSYDLTSVVDIHARPQNNMLVQLHGCLMAVAWVLSGSIGVLVARFYKGSWGTQTACGVKVWFSVSVFVKEIAFKSRFWSVSLSGSWPSQNGFCLECRPEVHIKVGGFCCHFVAAG